MLGTTCTDDCGPKKYGDSSDDTCKDCNTNCATCFGGLITECNSCESSYYLEGNECKTDCSPGLWERDSDLTC